MFRAEGGGVPPAEMVVSPPLIGCSRRLPFNLLNWQKEDLEIICRGVMLLGYGVHGGQGFGHEAQILLSHT